MVEHYQLAEVEREIERLREIMQGWQNEANRLLNAQSLTYAGSPKRLTCQVNMSNFLEEITNADLGGEQ